MTLLAALWGRLSGYVAALGALLAILLGVFLKGKASGKAAMQAEQDRHRREAAEQKRKRDSEIDNLAPADLDHRFNKWVRK